MYERFKTDGAKDFLNVWTKQNIWKSPKLH